MYASGLVIAVIPKARVARPLRRVNMIHALSHPRTTVIHVQHAELVLRLRQKPFAVFAPTRVIAALFSRTSPLVSSGLIASLFLDFLCCMHVAVSAPIPREIGAARMPAKLSCFQHRITPLTYYHDTLPHGRTTFTPTYPAKQKTPKRVHGRRVPHTSGEATASRTLPPGKHIK